MAVRLFRESSNESRGSFRVFRRAACTARSIEFLLWASSFESFVSRLSAASVCFSNYTASSFIRGPPRPVLRVCHPSSSMLPGYIIIVERHAKTSKPRQISLKLVCVFGIQCLIKPSSKQPTHTLAIFSGCGNFYTPHSSSTVSFVFFDNHVKRNSIVQSICYYSTVSLLLFCLVILSFFYLNSTWSA